MYTAYYKLKEAPFNQSVDPRFTWLSEKQSEALTSFQQNYLDKKGFFLITGDAGTGKTAFIKRLLAEIESKTIVATVTDPDLDKLDFFNWLSADFDLNVSFKSKGAFLTRFKRFLLEAHQKNIDVILIIDDAHRINQELVEEILTLSNIETAGKRLMSIFFVGQSGFNSILQENQNSKLRQSVNAHFKLKPLKEDEMVQLILHRLKVAGAKAEIFSSRAFHEIYQFSAGYPIMVVNVCDRAMMAGYVSATPIIDKDLIIECSRDLQIAGKKRKINNIHYSNKIAGSIAPAAKAIIKKKEMINKSLFGYLKIRLASVARTAILPVFLAMLCVVAIYLIYHFKSSLLTWTKIITDPEKSSSVQSEPSTSSVTQEKGNEVEHSIEAAQTQTELSDDEYALDELEFDDETISSDKQNAPTGDDSLQVKSDTVPTIPPFSETKIAEIIPGKVGTPIEKLPLELPEVETERESTEREFKLLSRHLTLKSKLSELERQETDIEEFPLELKSGGVTGAPPAPDSKAKKEVRPPPASAKRLYIPAKERQEADIQIVRQAPQSETISDALPAEDSTASSDVQPQLPVVEKPRLPALPAKSDIDPLTIPQQEPDRSVAALGQVNKGDDLRNRTDLKERLESFLEIYCQTYEEKNLEQFITFFASDAKENKKPFHDLLPKYRRNFDVIKFITYRIELQDYKYDEELGTMNIEGRFFLEWLPDGTRWRRNTGKIFMELQESGRSFKISRLDYYGDQPKKN
ncbi:MAG: AAA family ATPase [Desulfobacterales bacterium]|jgi:general secretion pathway protein A